MSDYFDVNLWGIIAMPVGVAICFGPLLLAAIMTRPDSPPPENPKIKK